MTWEKYESSFIKEATNKHMSESYISTCLTYASTLYKRNLPIIFNPYHFSRLIGYEETYLYSMAYAQQSFYATYRIPKRNGKTRRIDEPLPDLAYVQKWIATNILSRCRVSERAKAYRAKMSIKDNARFHRNQPIVMTIDIVDFFGSIGFHPIYSIFYQMGYGKKTSAFLTNLCTYKDKLPQGAPTSPQLSNLVFFEIDTKIEQFALDKKIRYTRYADDLTFSGDLEPSEIIFYITKILRPHGLIINQEKTRILRKNARQEVTGVVVNQHMQLAKSKRKAIRQEMYYINKFGINSHLDYINSTKKRYVEHLIGRINHAIFLNPKDCEMQTYREQLLILLKDEQT